MLSKLPENLKYNSSFKMVWRGEKDNQVRYLPANPLQDTKRAYENIMANYLAHSFCNMDPDALRVALDLCMIGKFTNLLRNEYFSAELRQREYDGRRFLIRLLVLIEDNISHFNCLIKNQQGDFAKFKIYNLKDSKEELEAFMNTINQPITT